MIDSFFNEIPKNSNGFVVFNNDKIAYGNQDSFLEGSLHESRIEDFLTSFLDIEGEIGSYPLTDNSAVVVIGETTGSMEEAQILTSLMEKVGMVPDSGLVSSFVGTSDVPIGTEASMLETNAQAMPETSSVSSTSSVSGPTIIAVILGIVAAGIIGGLVLTDFDDNTTIVGPYQTSCEIIDITNIPEHMLSLKVSELVNNGNRLYDRGEYSEALVYYQAAVTKDHNNVNALNGVGTSLEVMRDYNNSISCYNEVIKIEPNNINALNGIGNALVGLGNYEDALSKYQDTLELSSSNINALNGIGNALVGLGNYEDALSKYQDTLELSSSNVNALVGICKATTELFKYEEALETCDQALMISENNVNALIAKSRALIGLGEVDEAKNILDEILSENPENTDAREIRNKLR